MKRLKNINAKNEEQLKAIKDQGEKQLQILTSKVNKEVSFKNISFKKKLSFESKEIYDEIKEQNKKIDYTRLVCNGSCKHHYSFTIFLSLGNLDENIYNGNLPLKFAKIKQKNMENIIRSLENYNPQKGKYKTIKASTLLLLLHKKQVLFSLPRYFYKGRKMILSAFENCIFPLPKQYPSVMHGWREDEIDSSGVLPEEDEVHSK